jgi:hypothetical protein
VQGTAHLKHPELSACALIGARVQAAAFALRDAAAVNNDFSKIS